MSRRVKENPAPQTYNSYLGLLKHGNAYKVQKEVTKEYLLAQEIVIPFSNGQIVRK
ncbi:MAG TPA: hypothetical protein VJC15_04390 [Candidatus Paceibacterota bacterium]